ncbi:hypothetical protein EB796_012916 [Bugula neritina]|uniref:Uncharacterized protein n=1 Tax=Bugula neritina TaxID=10212 RepID=A0A7J7JTM8_BUGNE|nr:hypothetical protein EB796_012916 [Bugula neritina]
MKVEKVLYDSSNNMALIGKEFALVVFRDDVDQEHGVPNQHVVQGIYLRTLDTNPSVMLKFEQKQAGYMEELRLPASIRYSAEYAQRLLLNNKSSRNPFKVKLSRSK